MTAEHLIAAQIVHETFESAITFRSEQECHDRGIAVQEAFVEYFKRLDPMFDRQSFVCLCVTFGE